MKKNKRDIDLKLGDLDKMQFRLLDDDHKPIGRYSANGLLRKLL